jgi:hypothetical protein
VLIYYCIPFCYSSKNLGSGSSMNFVVIVIQCQSRYDLNRKAIAVAVRVGA